MYSTPVRVCCAGYNTTTYTQDVALAKRRTLRPTRRVARAVAPSSLSLYITTLAMPQVSSRMGTASNVVYILCLLILLILRPIAAKLFYIFLRQPNDKRLLFRRHCCSPARKVEKPTNTSRY